MKRNLLSLVALLVGFVHLALAQPSVVPGGVRFVYTGDGSHSVSLVGDFNGWSSSATPMKQLESGQWSVTIQLTPGTYQYAFLVDGDKIVTDPNNSLTFQTSDGERINSLISLSDENTVLMQGYPVRRNLNDSYEKTGGTVYLNLVFKHHLPLYYDPAKDMITAPFVRMHATRDYFDMADMILRYPNVHATAAISPTLLWQIQEIYVKRMEPYMKKTKRNLHRKWEINAAGFLAAMKGKTDPWIDACLTPAERLTDEDKAYLYKNEWNAFTMSPVRRQRFPELEALYGKWRDAKGNPNYTVDELRLLKFFAIFAHFDTEFFERDVPLIQTGTRIKKSLDMRDLVAFHSDGKYYLKRAITEDDCNRIVASAYQVMSCILPAFNKAKYNRKGKVGQLEIVATSYSDAVLPLLINSDIAKQADNSIALPAAYKHPEDADLQLQMSVTAYRNYLESEPWGYIPPYGAISEEVIPLLKKNGFDWFTSTDRVLEKSKPMDLDAAEPYTITVKNSTMNAVFSNSFLNNRVSWLYRNYYAENAADDFVSHILEHAPKDAKGSALVTVVIDADEHWMYYQRDIDGKGFMNSVYRKLNNLFDGNRAILSVTMSEYIDGNRGRGIPAHKPDKFDKISTLAAGSRLDGNFNSWIGNAQDNKAWEYLKQTRELIGKTAQPDTSMEYLERMQNNPFTIFYSATTQDWLQRFSSHEVLKLSPKPFEGHFLGLLKSASQAAGATAPAFAPFLSPNQTEVVWAKPAKKTRVTFICKLADREAITSLFVVGNRKELGNLEPNTVRMWDNGEYGDMKYGDNYWTLVIDITPGELIYKYSNSGGQGSWDGSEAFPDIWRKVMISGEKMTIEDVFARFH